MQSRIEQLHCKVANGDADIDDDQLTRLSNVAARLLQALGLNKRQSRPSSSKLSGLFVDKGAP